MTTVRVVLPAHLRTLTGQQGELTLPVADTVTTAAVLDALEATHPVLRGTMRDPVTGKRRRSSASSPAARTFRTTRWTSRSRRR